MTINEPDGEWSAYVTDQSTVRALFSGRVFALRYVRTLPGFDAAAKESYSEGAYFLPVVARTVEAFGGLVFARTPQRKAPKALDRLLGDVTGSGQDIDRFAEQAFDAILLTGGIAVLVDYATTETVTKAEAERLGLRHTLALYSATSILAARFRTEKGARQLAHVRLLEAVREQSPYDEFKVETVEQIRVLDLDEAGSYRVRLYRKPNGIWELYGEPIYPLMAGNRLTSIPIFFSNTRDGEPMPAKPPMTDLAEISIAHLNNSAALEWALLWTANPTPVFKGLNLPEGQVVSLGSSQGLMLSADGDAKFLEFTGKGLEELRLAIDTKRRDAAVMGARMLLEMPRSAITAETARIERAGEVSVVAGAANALSDCLTKALTFMAGWAAIRGKIEYWLNTNVNPAGLSAQELTSLIGAWTQGAISRRELFARLQQNEVIDPAKSFEDHEQEIAEDEFEPSEEDDQAAFDDIPRLTDNRQEMSN